MENIYEIVVIGIVAVGLLGYLFVAMLRPDKF
jgi:K+-transporting ATPase KdpF subunit